MFWFFESPKMTRGLKTWTQVDGEKLVPHLSIILREESVNQGGQDGMRLHD